MLVKTARPSLDYYNAKYKANVTLPEYYSHDLELVWKTADMDTVVRRLNAYLGTEDYQNLKPLPGAVKVLDKLKEKYELHIVTGRPNFTKKDTDTWLDKHFPGVFKSVVFTNFFKYEGQETSTKGDVCVRLGASYLIDDHLQHALSAAAKGVEVFLFGNYPWNKSDALPRHVVRVADWQAVAKQLL